MSEVNTTNNQPKVKTPEDQLADKLCIISLICYFGSSIISTILSTVLGSITSVATELDSGNADNLFSNILLWPITLVLSLGPLAGIILMIIARIKAPKNTFGKILMWVYIGLFILKFLLIIAALIIIGAGVAACASSLN